jgi:hypothetical protein
VVGDGLAGFWRFIKITSELLKHEVSGADRTILLVCLRPAELSCYQMKIRSPRLGVRIIFAGCVRAVQSAGGKLAQIWR